MMRVMLAVEIICLDLLISAICIFFAGGSSIQIAMSICHLVLRKLRTVQWRSSPTASMPVFYTAGLPAASPISQKIPAMMASPSRTIGASRCSFGACCEQAE